MRGHTHVFGVIMLFRGALGITHPTPRPNWDQCWRRSMWILSGQGLETSKDRASSSSLSNLYPGCSILQVGILFPNGQAEHSSYCPLLHLLSPLVRVWFWCHCSSWSYAFGLLFIRLDKLSSSTSLQWSCATLVALHSGSLQLHNIFLEVGGQKCPTFYILFDFTLWNKNMRNYLK